MKCIKCSEAKRSSDKALMFQEAGKTKSVLYYKSRLSNAAEVSRTIVDAAPLPFNATLLCERAVFGDQYESGHPDWIAYYNWRRRLCKSGNLSDFPVHVFGQEEQQQLAELLVHVFILGWDALLIAEPGRNLLRFSHDDRIEIVTGFNHRLLSSQLISLGFYEGKRREYERGS